MPILLHESLLDSRQFQSQVELKIWIWILLTAQKEDGFVKIKGRGVKSVKVKCGQLVYQRNAVAERLEIAPSTLGDTIKRMVQDGCITIEVADNQYSIITVVNRPKFQQETEDKRTNVKTKPTTIRQPSDNQKKADKEATPHWQKLVDVWFTDHEKNKGEKPTFNGVDTKALQAIVKNLQKRSEGKGIEWTEEAACDTLQKFLNYAWNDQWLKDNYLLPVLNQKLDKIITSGKSTSKPANRVEAANNDQRRRLAEQYASLAGKGGTNPG